MTVSSVVLAHGAMGWSAVCDCGISWSYSLAVLFMLEEERVGHTPKGGTLIFSYVRRLGHFLCSKF